MKSPQWVLRDAVLALHESLLAKFGGMRGLGDEGLLDSALARPEQLFAYGKPDLFALAAAYAFGLVRNHPFLDGNKRIGLATSILFLDSNGYRFTASEADATLSTLALAAGELDEAGYAKWLRENSRRSRQAK